MAVSKRKEKERLEKERIKKVGEKLLKEQMANEPDVKRETQRLMAEDSPESINYKKQKISELQSRIINAEKNTKPVWNSDKKIYDKVPVFKNKKDEYDYSFAKNNLGEYKGSLEQSIYNSKNKKPTDYGKEAVSSVNYERRKQAENSMRYPQFKSNPTSRTNREILSEKMERSNIKVGNKLFGENNRFSEWAKVNLDKISEKARERQKASYEQARKEYYNPNESGGYEYGTGRPKSEKAGEYFESIRKKRKKK